MTHPVLNSLVAGLMLWALLSLGAATAFLGGRPRDYWRHFGFMTGMWGLVDGVLAWTAFLRPPAAPGPLVPVLKFNAGLDLVYVAVALFLMARKTDRPRGFGLAVLVQGLFLLGFDLYFWHECASAAR